VPDLAGKVAIVTGAGRGIGRSHALALAGAGAKVVVNDLGAALSGEGHDDTPAQQVVAEIEGMGGEAIANGANVADFDEAGAMIQQAVDHFGRLDVLVNNAGILRDRMLVNMDESEWDSVIAVHLKGTYAPAHHAANYWRARTKQGLANDARIITTSSPSGIYGNVGQTNYGAAKAGIYGMVRVMSIEGRKYNIRVMGLAPGAFTRMTSDLPGRLGKEPDPMSLPENIAPGVLYMVSDLAAEHSGKILGVSSRGVREIKMLQTSGFNPTRPYTAQDVADHASEVFFQNAEERTAQTA
jgi:NAD(P)-dependent dehydrogenase (short-subunit alcohol dehydrogenase family)